MSNDDDLYIVLGCFGRRDDNFVSCPSVENRILKIGVSIQGYETMMNYFEGCRLFDRPMFDINAVRNFVFYMQEKYDQGMKRLWSEKEFSLYQKFIIDHRMCGSYIKLILVNGELDKPIEEEPKKIFIKGTNQTSLPRVRRIK